jgi:uncharacterized protein YndB with AHSA1/START domain
MDALGIELSPETLALLDDVERDDSGTKTLQEAVRRSAFPRRLSPVFEWWREPAGATALRESECSPRSMARLPHRVTAQIEIDVPIERVFSYVTDPRNLADWHQGVSDVRDVSGAPGGGQRFTFTAHFLGKRLTATHEVTDFEPNSLFAWRAVSGPYRGAQSFRFEPTGDGTVVILNLAVQDLNFLGKLAEPLILHAARRNEQHCLETLKDLLEIGVTA